jgi:hypothetical protein
MTITGDSRTLFESGYLDEIYASSTSSKSLTLKSMSGSGSATGAGNFTFNIPVPIGARIEAVQFRNDTVIVGTAATYLLQIDATASGGITVDSAVAFAKNTKINMFWDANLNGPSTINKTVLVTCTGNVGNLNTGTVTAIVYYSELTPMPNL